MRKVIFSVVTIVCSFAAGYHTALCSCDGSDVPAGDRVITRTVVEKDTFLVRIEAPAETVVTTRFIPYPVGRDTVFVPEERRVYEDSSYRAVVSGFRPALDSLTIYPRRVVETRLLPAPRRSRWGIGVTAGAAITPGGVSPALTVGVTYTFAEF